MEGDVKAFAPHPESFYKKPLKPCQPRKGKDQPCSREGRWGAGKVGGWEGGEREEEDHFESLRSF